MVNELIAFGNKGGDRLEVRLLHQGEDTAFVHLKVGHCCVYSINAIVPVELLTSLLTKALRYGDIKGAAPEWLEWSEEVNAEIVDGIAAWRDFDNWWYEHREASMDLEEAFLAWRESGND